MVEYPVDGLEDLCRRVRLHCVEMTHKVDASHIGSALSIVEILVTLYTRVLRVDPQRPDLPDRDRFIQSKGHACTALYSVLAETGFFPLDLLDTYYLNGSTLAGHVSHHGVPGIELSTGSLGHGLPVATGMALVGKRDQRPFRAFCLMSDGECDEGSNWESILFAPQHHLDNLVAIVDYNKIQSLAPVKDVIDLEPLADKWQKFGWEVREVNGHSLSELDAVFQQIPFKPGKPSVIIAHTTKGKGISFMENTVAWHYRSPQGKDYETTLAELGGRE